MPAAQVLRFERSDQGDTPFVLVRVEQDADETLDLRLVGTDGISPFLGRVRHRDLDQLKAKNYSGDDEEWRSILKAIFLRDTNAGSAGLLENVEAIASVDDRIRIVIRKNISGITVSLQSRD